MNSTIVFMGHWRWAKLSICLEISTGVWQDHSYVESSEAWQKEWIYPDSIHIRSDVSSLSLYLCYAFILHIIVYKDNCKDANHVRINGTF